MSIIPTTVQTIAVAPDQTQVNIMHLYDRQTGGDVYVTNAQISVDSGNYFPTSLTSTNPYPYNSSPNIKVSVDFQGPTAAMQNLTQAFTNINSMYPMSWTAPGQPKEPPRGFNKYLNASDMLEEFIKFLGNEHVSSSEAREMPMEMFITWLLVRAHEEDGQAPPEALFELDTPKHKPKPQLRCLGCRQFMKSDTRVPVHDGRCSKLVYDRERRRKEKERCALEDVRTMMKQAVCALPVTI